MLGARPPHTIWKFESQIHQVASNFVGTPPNPISSERSSGPPGGSFRGASAPDLPWPPSMATMPDRERIALSLARNSATIRMSVILFVASLCAASLRRPRLDRAALPPAAHDTGSFRVRRRPQGSFSWNRPASSLVRLKRAYRDAGQIECTACCGMRIAGRWR